MRIITNTIKSNPYAKTAIKIADEVLALRRPFRGERFTNSDYSYLQTRIATRALPFIQRDEKLPVVIVGFSLKCPSPLKTISQNADRAEYEALSHLNNFCEKLTDAYDVGTDFKIFTDGRIFVDTIIGATDERVSNYNQELRSFLTKLKSKDIEIIAPEDFYKTTPQKARLQLFTEFPVNRAEMDVLLEKDAFLKEYKTQMRDFYAKDIRSQNPNLSIRQSKKQGLDVAMGVICAAESLRRYIHSVFNGSMMRLSVHAKPVFDFNNIVGIYLNSLKANCPMPWHGAAIKISQIDGSEKFIYEKKSLLEKCGCELIPNLDGKGEYYQFPDKFNYNPHLSFKENINV